MADFLKAIRIAAQGMRAQSGRMRVVAENIANAESAPQRPGEAPYRRKIATFEKRYDAEIEGAGLQLGRVRQDQTAFRSRFEPGHPAADSTGMVALPNVDSLVEQMDMREAQRAYEANLGVVSLTRRMIARTIDILKT